MAVSAKRLIPSPEQTDRLMGLLSTDTLEATVDWWVLYSKSRADERDTAFAKIPEAFLKSYAQVFGHSLMASKTKKSDAFAAMQKLLTHIQRHPELVTPTMYDAMANESKFHWIVSLVSRKTDAKGMVYLVPSSQANSVGNLLDAEAGINLQNMGMAKLKMIMEAITPELVKDANLGALSKAGRDIMALMHVLKLDFQPDQELIREYKEIEESDGKTKRERITRFTEKNRKAWGAK